MRDMKQTHTFLMSDATRVGLRNNYDASVIQTKSLFNTTYKNISGYNARIRWDIGVVNTFGAVKVYLILIQLASWV